VQYCSYKILLVFIICNIGCISRDNGHEKLSSSSTITDLVVLAGNKKAGGHWQSITALVREGSTGGEETSRKYTQKIH